jgi:hypothetical protein
MIGPIQQEIIQAAEHLYATQLRSHLEPAHNGEFIAIEPESGDYFLGKTLSSAIQASRRAHPSRLSYTMRVGTNPAIHMGTWR